MSTPPDQVYVYDNLRSYLPDNPAYTVLSIIQSAMNDGVTDQVDSMEVAFMLTDRPGTFTVETPQVYENVPDPQAQAFLIDEDVAQAVGIIEQIYALA